MELTQYNRNNYEYAIGGTRIINICMWPECCAVGLITVTEAFYKVVHPESFIDVFDQLDDILLDLCDDYDHGYNYTVLMVELKKEYLDLLNKGLKITDSYVLFERQNTLKYDY